MRSRWTRQVGGDALGVFDKAVEGVGDIEMALRRAGKGYVLGVKSNEPFHSWDKPRRVAGTAMEIADGLPASAWRCLSAGAGAKGERLHDWAYLELADLNAGDYSAAFEGQLWTRGLLIRRKIADGDLAFFTTWARPKEPRSRNSRKSKAVGGRSKTVSKPPRTNSASTTTRRARGMVGDVTSRL